MKTKNTKLKRTGNMYGDTATIDINNIDSARETENEGDDDACLENVQSQYFVDGNKSIDSTTGDDDELVSNGGDTSTSFSLQECMDEFRSRRIRKSSLSQNRQEIGKRKCSNSTLVDGTDQEIINQNLCNKEQERKCKPCKNGFCYCFTSDSGDAGGNLIGCNSTRGPHLKNQRRNKRINNDNNSNNLSNNKNLSKVNKKIPQAQTLPEKVELSGNGNRRRNQIVAISRLETSTKDEPLVHIIQELHNNCVISEVRVNRDKINSSTLSAHANGSAHSGSFKPISKNILTTSSNDHSKHLNFSNHENPQPSAPTLEQILERKTPQKSQNNSKILDKHIQYRERGHNAGGLLLRKRLSGLKFDYEPRNTKIPPPKPPRNSLGIDDKYTKSVSSTSSSVKEAEQVVEQFLAKRGLLINDSYSKTHKELAERTNVCSKNENDKRKSCPTSSKPKNKSVEIYMRGRSSCSDPEDSVTGASTKDVDYGKNIHPVVESKTNDWQKSKINHMLNYEKTTKSKTFHSGATKAEPQQRKSIEGEEALANPIGWQIPQKINLDTVDGVECHNLASNLIDKSTPIKKRLIPKLKSSQRKKFPWSEQLRQISPWSNKKSKGNNKRSSSSRSSPKEFIKLSKNKFLRFVSPKKENKDAVNIEIRKTPFRNVGVQTSCEDVSHCRSTNTRYENSSSSQSPPGSYHSPKQSPHIKSITSTQSQDTTSHEKECISNHFDFSRIVHSPPRKAPRSSHRKLNFAHKEIDVKNDEVESILEADKEEKTYRSFNKDYNQDASISKISYILNNIRTKLEQNDKQAVRAFLKTEFDVERSGGYDCPDSHRVETNPPKNIQRPLKEVHLTDPIYSEIEENSIHIIESPNFDNHTGVQRFKNVNYPEVLYAKVNKRPKPVNEFTEVQLQKQSQLPLAKIIHESLKNRKILTNITPLPPLHEPSGSDTVSYSSPTLCTKPLAHCQSLNNVRVLEHNTIPNQRLYMSKSDLSLHRSEIFLENLCSSELNIKEGFLQNSSKKVLNSKTNISYASMSEPITTDDSSKLVDREKESKSDDSVSYEMPNDDIFLDDIASSSYDASNLTLNAIKPPSCNNQSTPKKQSFITKDDSNINEINVNVVSMNDSGNTYNSCFNMSNDLRDDICSIDKSNQYHSLSLNEATEFDTPNILSSRYKFFKTVLRKSFKKCKDAIHNERRRFFAPLNVLSSNPSIHHTIYGSTYSDLSSNLNLEELFSFNEDASLCDQIAHTVSVCRKLPDVKRSSEMVEAERLLLLSTSRQQNKDVSILSASNNQSLNQMPNLKFFIDEMILPIHTDLNKDIYFNYFYIVTFQYGDVIKSTQSAEYGNDAAIFRDCGLEFASRLCCMEPVEGSRNTIQCKVFMLRLRKISSPSIEPKNRTVIKTLTKASLSSIRSNSTSSSLSSVNEVVSRFRLQGSFTVDASSFNPYEYVSQASHNTDQICLRASRFSNIPITLHKKSSNLATAIQLKGRAEVRFPKPIFKGFLNVRDLTLIHSWNRRWCILDGIFLYVLHDENTLNTNPLIVLDLRDTNKYLNYPLTNASRELCARPRSFCLEMVIPKECESSSRATVFFSAETQEDLDEWLKNINNVLHFIKTWLS